MKDLSRLDRVMLPALVIASVTVALAHADTSQQCGGMPCRSNGVPYLDDKGAIVIYPGEHFVIAFEIENGKIVNAVPNPTGGQLSNAVEVSFAEVEGGMMLTLENHLPSDVKYDASMRAPDDRLVYTSSCPVGAGLSAFESWPQPIKALELSNFRYSTGSACE